LGSTEVVSALYLDSTIDQFDYGIEPTDRPHATFEVTSMGPEVSADASGSTSVENSVTSYEWSAHQYEQPEYGESLNWDVSGGETVEFEWGDSDEYLADLVLKVTDEEGRTDDSNRRVRIE
jgi:hypothetical protein